jgi:regulator of RNase E activity RraA
MVAAARAEDVSEGFRLVEAASVSDAMEQLYATKAYMSHDMRPLAQTKFAGPAITVLLKKEEHHEGAPAQQGMLDAIDEAPAGSVYVIVLEDGLDYAAVGGLMTTAMKVRGLTGAIVDGSIRDTPQITKLQFPVFSRGVAPSTTINHYRGEKHTGHLRGRSSASVRYRGRRHGRSRGGAKRKSRRSIKTRAATR